MPAVTTLVLAGLVCKATSRLCLLKETLTIPDPPDVLVDLFGLRVIFLT